MNYKTLFYLWLTLIVFFSIAPQDINSSLLSGMRVTKSGFFQHVLAYFVLSALACLAFKENNIWAIFGGILIMSIVLEMIQYALPTGGF